MFRLDLYPMQHTTTQKNQGIATYISTDYSEELIEKKQQPIFGHYNNQNTKQTRSKHDSNQHIQNTQTNTRKHNTSKNTLRKISKKNTKMKITL